MSQDFPDQAYLDRIRASLWRRGAQGNAAVMVGAGMSINARPRGAGGSRFPSWPDLARTVVDHLYPAHGEGNSGHRTLALEQAKVTSGFLRLAQEYETAFGREALERLINDAVPDLRFEPGDLHERLLKLPWSDVFTTNWDTLLERAATRIIDRHYDLVRTVADIPASIRPRIVKLHGTLPAIRPLIFTEEDFRTYPIRFAPFVNLAQQSMMESVFCLVGFSGDDPNFLYWSGWVRDHLRNYAPRIYLVGWLDLSPPRRRMLESRGVIPIDVAQLPVPTPWPEEVRQQRALEWFLWSLEEAEPYREIDWPIAPDRNVPSPPAYLAVVVDNSDFPRQESVGPAHSPDVDELRDTLEIWRHNRRLYPGWLVAPGSARYHLWSFTGSWIPAVLELLPALLPGERIEALDELNWRLETSLVPLTAELVVAISEALSAVDPLAPSPLLARASHGDLRRRWVELAAASLRAAREADDDATFERWAEALAPHRPENAWVGPRIACERCLLGLARLDHAAVERALEDLDTSADDAFWKLRKAGILAELGKTEESFRLAREGLTEIRQQFSHGSADIPTLSREGWAMVLALGFSFYPHPKEPVWETDGPSTIPRGIEPPERSARRWEVLRRFRCDARQEFYETHRAIESDPPGPKPGFEEKSGFDHWQRTRIWWTHRHSTDTGWEHLPGLQAKRLVEEVGLPPVVDHIALAKGLLLRTANWLAEPTPVSALGVVLRVSDFEKDETFDEFFNRSRIAMLPDSQVNALVDRVGRALDYGLPKAAAAMTEEDHDRSAYWVGRARVAIELLSRLVLRLEGDKAEQVLDRALGFYKLPLFRRHPWLAEPLEHLFFRTLAALDPMLIRTRLLSFLALRLADEGDFDTDSPGDWPDPFRLAAHRIGDASPSLTDGPERNSTINRLIAAAASTPLAYPRWPAIKRLEVLLRWGILTAEETARFGEALWQHRLPCGFPEGPWPPLQHNFIFLSLPSPEPGLAERLFRQRYLATPDTYPQLPSEGFFRNLLGAAKAGLNLLPAEAEQVLEHALASWRSGHLRRAVEDPHAPPSHLQHYKEALTQALGEAILPRIEPASTKVGEIVLMVADLRALDFPVEAIYPALARLRSDLLPEVSDRLRQSLVSYQRKQAEAAINAVLWWLQNGRQLELGEPPPDLVREIAIAVSMRRPSLQAALKAVAWILRNNAVAEAERFARLVDEGLAYLLSTARYELGLARQQEPSFRPIEISELRVLCVKAAIALDGAGFGHMHSVGEWLREARMDPFPEVRHAVSASEEALPTPGMSAPSV